MEIVESTVKETFQLHLLFYCVQWGQAERKADNEKNHPENLKIQSINH